MKHLKRFNEGSEELSYNKDLIETLKEISLEYLDEFCILNYYIMSLNGSKMFYGGQYSHYEDRFNCYNKIKSNTGSLKYLIMINDKPYQKKVVGSSFREDQFINQSDFNKEKSNELVGRLREIYPREIIGTKP